jgi:hypothetical protein
LLQNAVPLEGAPHLLQNLAAGESALIGKGAGSGTETGAGGETWDAADGTGESSSVATSFGTDWEVAGRDCGLAANRLSAPHFTQNIPSSDAPHLLQKRAIFVPSLKFGSHNGTIHLSYPCFL